MTYGVVTVTRNAAATLGRTIDSVLSQVVAPAEYIFVDGGSTDDTLAIIERAQDTFARSRSQTRTALIHQTSSGITNAWNVGIERVQADLVFVLNADDWYEPNTAESVMREFSVHPEIDVLLAAGRYFDPKGQRNPVVCRPRPAWVLPFAMTAVHPACFVRRALYDRIGFFDEKYAIVADYEFIYRCVDRGVCIRSVDTVLVNVLEGGTATQQRRRARVEMAEVGSRYAALSVAPALALHVRRLLDR